MPLMPPPSMLNTVNIFPFAKPVAISIFKRAFRTVIQVSFSKLMPINVVYQAHIRYIYSQINFKLGYFMWIQKKTLKAFHGHYNQNKEFYHFCQKKKKSKQRKTNSMGHPRVNTTLLIITSLSVLSAHLC